MANNCCSCCCDGVNSCIVNYRISRRHLPQVYVSYPYITGKTLEPNTTFAALSLMNLLTEPMYFLPMTTSLLVNAFVGVRRFETFFMAPEMERSHEIQWTEYFSKDKVTSSFLLLSFLVV